MKHILLSFDSARPECLSEIDPACHIWLFIPAGQEYMPMTWCEVLCRFGKRVHFVFLPPGSAADPGLVWAYHLGRIAAQDPDAAICLLSDDNRQDIVLQRMRAQQHCLDVVRFD
ncbi:hypothetical protein [Neisseria shayeganii]|uniref:Uncharacterized protein n=1 Tax=Neisseria shayeganii TaxID=607712 RepID=A0A7D7SHG1_9NEIS|nr:hypothetical protein [Neisseria shayeganii]QMT40027.1 hypothetical protein H3L94_09235 [Neisseria shayeganii]